MPNSPSPPPQPQHSPPPLSPPLPPSTSQVQPSVGYCQGMVMIAAVVLYVLPPQLSLQVRTLPPHPLTSHPPTHFNPQPVPLLCHICPNTSLGPPPLHRLCPSPPLLFPLNARAASRPCGSGLAAAEAQVCRGRGSKFHWGFGASSLRI
jgi:hypothetical protein